MTLANQQSAITHSNFLPANFLYRSAIQNIISDFFFEGRLYLRHKFLPLFCPSIYRGLMISSYQDTDRKVHHDTIYPDIQIGQYIALCISRYLIGCNSSRFFDWLSISFATYSVPLSKKWREETPRALAHPMGGKRRRPSCDGRFSIAPLPTLAGQKVQFSLRKSEQAEVGQSLTCLPLRCRKGLFGNPPGVPVATVSGKIKENGTLGRVRYIHIARYVAIWICRPIDKW